MDYQLHRVPCKICNDGCPGFGKFICTCSDPECLVAMIVSEKDMKANLYRMSVETIEKSRFKKLTCKGIIWDIIQHHRNKFSDGLCGMGLAHDILYVAVRIMLKYKFQNRKYILILLGEIFKCEGSIDRLVLGAIYGPSVFIDGWRNEFVSRKECIQALHLFLEHATNAGMLFGLGDLRYYMVGLPLLNGELPLEAATRERGRTGGKIVMNLLLKYSVIARKRAQLIKSGGKGDSGRGLQQKPKAHGITKKNSKALKKQMKNKDVMTNCSEDS